MKFPVGYSVFLVDFWNFASKAFSGFRLLEFLYIGGYHAHVLPAVLISSLVT